MQNHRNKVSKNSSAQSQLPVLTPVYFDKVLIKNILSASGNGYAPIHKTYEKQDKINDKKIKFGGDLGVELSINEVLSWLGKAKANGTLDANIDTSDILQHIIETSVSRENTEFGVLYQEIPKLKQAGLIKQINFENKNNVSNGLLVEFNCSFRKNSFVDTLRFISEMIRLFIQAQEEYVANTYDFNNFNHELVNSEEFQTNLMLELLKSKRAIQSNIPNYEWVPVTKKIIDEVLPLLEKSDMSEIRCEITGLSTIYTTVLIEKEFLIGSIDKFYGNQFTVLGKILKYEEKGAYLPLESTILGQIDSSMLNKLDEGINRIYEILKPFQVSSQLDKSKNNLRVTGVPILKILPIAIYI